MVQQIKSASQQNQPYIPKSTQNYVTYNNMCCAVTDQQHKDLLGSVLKKKSISEMQQRNTLRQQQFFERLELSEAQRNSRIKQSEIKIDNLHIEQLNGQDNQNYTQKEQQDFKLQQFPNIQFSTNGINRPNSTTIVDACKHNENYYGPQCKQQKIVPLPILPMQGQQQHSKPIDPDADNRDDDYYYNAKQSTSKYADVNPQDDSEASSKIQKQQKVSSATKAQAKQFPQIQQKILPMKRSSSTSKVSENNNEVGNYYSPFRQFQGQIKNGGQRVNEIQAESGKYKTTKDDENKQKQLQGQSGKEARNFYNPKQSVPKCADIPTQEKHKTNQKTQQKSQLQAKQFPQIQIQTQRSASAAKSQENDEKSNFYSPFRIFSRSLMWPESKDKKSSQNRNLLYPKTQIVRALKEQNLVNLSERCDNYYKFKQYVLSKIQEYEYIQGSLTRKKKQPLSAASTKILSTDSNNEFEVHSLQQKLQSTQRDRKEQKTDPQQNQQPSHQYVIGIKQAKEQKPQQKTQIANKDTLPKNISENDQKAAQQQATAQQKDAKAQDTSRQKVQSQKKKIKEEQKQKNTEDKAKIVVEKIEDKNRTDKPEQQQDTNKQSYDAELIQNQKVTLQSLILQRANNAKLEKQLQKLVVVKPKGATSKKEMKQSSIAAFQKQLKTAMSNNKAELEMLQDKIMGQVTQLQQNRDEYCNLIPYSNLINKKNNRLVQLNQIMNQQKQVGNRFISLFEDVAHYEQLQQMEDMLMKQVLLPIQSLEQLVQKNMENITNDYIVFQLLFEQYKQNNKKAKIQQDEVLSYVIEFQHKILQASNYRDVEELKEEYENFKGVVEDELK